MIGQNLSLMIKLSEAIFLIVRHPLKIIWSIVAIAFFAFLVNLESEDSKLQNSFLSNNFSNYYAHPLIFEGFKYLHLNDIKKELSQDNTKVLYFQEPNHQEVFVVINKIQSWTLSSNLQNLVNAMPGDTLHQFFSLLMSRNLIQTTIFALGFLGVVFTTIRLFWCFRGIGSRCSLACCALLMSAMDSVFALFLLNLTGKKIDGLLIIELAPLLIVSVGFQKTIFLSRTIYKHSKDKGEALSLLCGIQEASPKIIKEYIRECFLFGLFAFSGVSGLSEFSLLAVFVLLVDCILLHSFFLGILAFRMRLHARRAERQIDVEQSWTGYSKLIVTLLTLILYAFNVLKTLSSFKIDVFTIAEKSRELLQDNDVRVTVMPFIFVRPLGVAPYSRILVLIYEIWNRVLSPKESTSLNNFIQISIFLALPLSLVFNYYLMTLLQKAKVAISHNSEKAVAFVENFKNLNSKTSDDEISNLLKSGKLPLYSLERRLGDCERAVELRRNFLSESIGKNDIFELLPFEDFDYKMIYGTNCENVVGYVPIPVGIAGPILVDEKLLHVPMATTEGALIASCSRGMKAILYAGGASTIISDDGMTRGPVVSMPSAKEAQKVSEWIEQKFELISQVFSGNSRFLKLKSVKFIFDLKVANFYRSKLELLES